MCEGDSFATTKWFCGSSLNATFNCLDRHLVKSAAKIALYWEGDQPHESRSFTYLELYNQVNRFANVLKSHNIKAHSKVCIYLPMIPEALIAMLACARIGAIHSIVFAGFSAAALKERIVNSDCELVVTADEGVRGGKTIPLKKQVDAALSGVKTVKKVIVVKRTLNEVPFNHKRDVCYHTAMQTVNAECPYEAVEASHPLFILYTSGSTAKPKGILHGTAGYLVYVATTFKYIFDYQPQDVFWCTADLGWITGHSYGLYGPLLNGATIVMYEGIPTYPNPSRYWQIIDKYQVNIFYTAPTAIRALRKEGDNWVKQTERSSLKLLGTVGEPINPDAWDWYYRVVGEERCSIVDTWWQTETGGIMISPLPGAATFKPGSVSWPFFGIGASIVDDDGVEVAHNTMGKLVLTKAWPGMMLSIYGDHNRFEDTYFKDSQNYYITGDVGYQDEDGCFWISGRSDDVIKISGHRIGSEEVESALVSHPFVAEAAVVGVTDAIKGQVIYAYVTLINEKKPSHDLEKDLILKVRETIGAIATPRYIQWAANLPKTRSGKILRRLLRKIANGDKDLGDLSTLADASIVEQLIQNHEKIKKTFNN